jgi:hypothetical protein
LVLSANRLLFTAKRTGGGANIDITTVERPDR